MTQPRLLGGRYELDGVVGRGGMAEVYRARDIRLDRTVAVKTLRIDLARDPTFQARFRREAQSAASLNHPSIIAVYDTGEDDFEGTTVPYIVMEYADGHTLRDLIQDDRRLLPERTLEIIDGILRALDYSHRNGIVHRDIKPANVMLTGSGEVKVMDFGIARSMSDAQATMTQTAQVIGTAQYLSPEQARGERVDARSDIYSTGCVLYELLTGRPPFTGDSPVAIAYQHVREDPIPPSQFDPDIPAWADSIVLHAMAKDANMRYQGAGEMRADIQRVLAGMPINAAPATMAMGGPMTASPAGTTSLPPYQYGEPEDMPPDSGRGKRIALWSILGLLVVGGLIMLGVILFAGDAEKVYIPDVKGKTPAAATSELQAKDFKVQQENEASSEVDKGLVTRTDPAGGTDAEHGATITMYVSTGPKKTTVPNVLQQSQEDAEQAIREAKLEVGEVTERESTQAPGTVLKQSPAGSRRVNEGTDVKLIVAKSIERVEVPRVVGMTEAEARRAILDAGLQPRVYTEENSSVEPGRVYQQDPTGGTARKNSSVSIFVAEAPPTQEPTEDPSPDPTISIPGRGDG
ncbi:MAG: Stk1 family PASTA domain-containing Ser/Thr kinase [Streptosporangiales bacterium]|nr:Stk1 family PASTA domain-containing Ser/Thr kinase [Streptosporangiales bacterium]